MGGGGGEGEGFPLGLTAYFRRELGYSPFTCVTDGVGEKNVWVNFISFFIT